MSNRTFHSPMRAALGAALKCTLLGASLTLVTSGCGAPVDAPSEPAEPPAAQAERHGDEDAPRQALEPANADWSAPHSEDPHEYDAHLAASTPEGRTSALAVPSCNANDLDLTWWPMSGANGRAWMVNNYVDLDPASSLLEDYLGFTGNLARTYDGHRGIDIDISSFREMDSGSALVRAAAAGTVTFVEESQFDRNTSCTGSWNVVRIEHANGYDTLYGHLKRNSVVVNVGDTVVAGQVLGVAGSAGCSTQPHLHFELQDCSNTAVESFALGMWTSPPAYHAPSDVMDVMLRKGTFTSSAQIKDPVPNPGLYAPGEPLGIGLSMSGRGGDVVDMSLTAPNGAVDAWTWTVPGAARYRHLYPSWNKVAGTTPGTWTLRVRINSSLRATRTFNVSTVQPGLAEVARHGIPSASYQTVFDDITAAGYRPVWVDGYEDGSSTYYNAVFRPGDGYAWAARHVLTGTQYQSELDAMDEAGYRLMQVDSYVSGGTVRYSALFTKRPGPLWVAYHGKTAAEHQALFDTYSQSYRLVNASVVSVGGQRYVTALYDKASVGGWVASAAIPASQYQDTFDAQREAGRYLQYVNTYMHGGVVYYSAVWDSMPYGGYVARHDRTSAQYQTEFNTWTGAGYLTRLVTGVSVNGSHRFTALWTH
ncbi:peptidoglycan DD-metalloendopeptidase family protein [Pyxidicoccus xibeiensis]|uniref:peptidoglycan DD-metalloendopeptidase family protein n=1 Tax=Pyxidicoccus xibeiensis TaxID=2906759 RepID=UPI0020A7C522|nr:peptidoglycan DD-metalloendopeptidase family protein [Pyxidicoccus xibeiensis]MCP3143265.1 peptidoglycan DD-metalloendopeptidase family protein [Pyxidicoccus xibeiensis]